MMFSYRTRRRLKRLGIAALFLLMIAIIGWFCWVVWVERYIVYTRDGASINFDLPVENLSGEVAVPPVPGEGPQIHYNEGDNAINTSTDMVQMYGYYITGDMLADDLDEVKERIAVLPSNTSVMIDMKSGYGSFYYNSGLADAVISQSVNIADVEALINQIKNRNLYLIARIPAFQDYCYALNHVTSGIPFTGGGGALWMDTEGCYWLKPTDSAVHGWLTSIILELRGMGFDEVVLDDFMVPDSQRVVYNGDREADLVDTATKLITTCSTSYFTVSFRVSSATFPLPEGRCRMYVGNIAGKDVEITAAQTGLTDPQIRLVFLAETNDTRYDAYSVLRPMHMLELDDE